MANVNRINGFSPVGYLNGAYYTGQARTYAIPISDTTASYAIGDWVQSAGGSDSNGVLYVRKIPAAQASSAVLLGVIVGVSVADPGASLQGSTLSLDQLYLNAGTRTVVKYVLVADDPNTLFEVSGGATATNLTQAKAGYNAGLGSFYSGADQTYAINQNATVTTLSSASPVSNIIVPSASIATTNTLPIRLLGLAQKAGNEFGAYSRLLCRANNHEFSVGTGTNFTAI